MSVLPADLASPHLEASRAHALMAATAEIRSTRELLERTRETLNAALETDRIRREGYTAAIGRLLAETAKAGRELREQTRRHDACATQLSQSERALDEVHQQVTILLKVADIEPKLKRIQELIDVLDQAELIRWHR